MIFWILSVLYMGAGVACMPMFTRDSYEIQRARWSIIHSKQESMNYALGCAWMKSWVWPVYLLMHWAAWKMCAEDRAKELEKQKKLSVVQAKRIIEEDKRKQENEWLDNFKTIEIKEKVHQ